MNENEQVMQDIPVNQDGYTYQELVEKFSAICIKVQFKANNPEANFVFTDEEVEVLAILHSLLIPRNVINITESEHSEFPIGECPRCHSKALTVFNNCVNCGQKLGSNDFVDILDTPDESFISLDTPIDIEVEEETKND